MNPVELTFYAFAGLTVVSALWMLYSRNVLHIAFLLLLAMLGLAALYVFAEADFVAVAQLMIYVGGVLVLLVFGVMYTNDRSSSGLLTGTFRLLPGVLLALFLFGGLAYGILTTDSERFAMTQRTPIAAKSTVQALGTGLLTDQIVSFEVAGLLLLVALIGAAHIASGRHQDKP